jgi:hypothetical protein
VPRLQRQILEGLLSVVRTVDDALNNTSAILLFEAGQKRMLFAGDAQIENWEYALSRQEDLDLLRGVDLYKVGHHGSRNATPRKLFNLWNESANPQQLLVMMSTLSGFHGRTEQTAVPRATLVNALKSRGDFHSTDDLGEDVAYVEVSADLTVDGAWRFVPSGE